MAKKIMMGAIAILFVFLVSIPIAPIGDGCAGRVASVCGLISNFILVVGGAVVLKSEVESFLLPGTNVEIELDSGEIKPGTLTRKAVSGRLVKNGDRVKLNCSAASPNSQNLRSKICELEFLGFDPNSSCTKGSPCYGKIPSWSISVDQLGNPDPGLARFR